MTENKFDLLTTKVDEDAKRSEAASRLSRRFAEVIQDEGLGFNEAHAALYHVYNLMNQIYRDAHKTDQ